MKKILLILVAAGGMLGGCKKEDSSKPSVKSNEGTIRFTNVSKNPYTVFIGGNSQGTVQGNSFKEVSKYKGTYQVSAIQQSGYVLYPTEVSNWIEVSAGGEVEFVFP